MSLHLARTVGGLAGLLLLGLLACCACCRHPLWATSRRRAV